MKKIKFRVAIDEIHDGDETAVRIVAHFYNAAGRPLAHEYKEGESPDIEPQLDAWRQALMVLWPGHKIDSREYEVRLPGLTLAHKDIGTFVSSLMATGIVVYVAGVRLAFDEIMARREALLDDEELGVDR